MRHGWNRFLSSLQSDFATNSCWKKEPADEREEEEERRYFRKENNDTTEEITPDAKMLNCFVEEAMHYY